MRRQARTPEGRSRAKAVVKTACSVAEVMGTELFTLTPDTVVASALRLAGDQEVHHFLVIQDGSLTGIVCDSDLKQARDGTMVGACMKSPVLCISPDTTVTDAADIMAENEVGCLPVVTGSFLVGLVTRSGLALVTGQPHKRVDPIADKVEHLCGSCGASKGVTAHVRSGVLHLCHDCAAMMPVGEKAGNRSSN